MARRRGVREQPFGFDAFVDLVTNLVGVVLRLILVVMMGAHLQGVYRAKIVDPEAAVAAETEPESATAGMREEIEREKAQVAELQAQLVEALRSLDLLDHDVQKLSTAKQQRAAVAVNPGTKQSVEGRLRAEAQTLAALRGEQRSLQQRIAELQQGLAELAKKPPDKRTLRAHHPLSQPVNATELFFECRGGRVTFVDVQAFLDQVKQSLGAKTELLKTQWEVTELTRPVGAFQMKYTIARLRSTGLDRAYGNLPPTESQGFSYGLDSWEMQPVLATRGEAIGEALSVGSDFRHVTDRADPDQAVLTFFVYPDSFELFRQLRDFLYQRGFVVAGRPLPQDHPIGFSRRGSISQGQ